MSESGSGVFELYERALERPVSERAAWLHASGAAEADVERVLSMLRAEATVAGLNVARGGVEVAAAMGEVEGTGDDPLPTLRGHYRIIRAIGEGGMGTVYEAEQGSPRRRVAIKALRSGLASRRAVARLRAEADILARLQHPGIAQVFEAGLGDEAHTEQAFIVMELVDGRPIHRHAEAAGLSQRERVRLMLGVCDAVEHAHRRGVIHRDLKPANILVTPDGRAKVLDFGVARLVASGVAGGVEGVEEAGIVGTLGYMSPEQAEGRSSDVDVRADVYALGAVLYHVLTGRPPLALEGLDLAESLKAIRTQEPVPAGRVDRALRGDLECVLARAMARRVEDRYPGVAALAADLRAHLTGHAVEARGDRRLYVAGRFLRRHWAGASVAAAGLAGVVVFAGLAASEAQRSRILAAGEREARGAADEAAESLRRALYRSHIGMARASLLGGDAGAAGRALAACDPGERGWEWGYLADRLDRSERRFAPFSDGWLNLCVSRGVVAVTHHSEGVVLLDAATGRELARDAGLTNVTALASLEAGAFVAATERGELLVIESPSLRVRARHAVTDGLARAVAVAGERVFVLDQQAGVVVVDIATGDRLATVKLPSQFGYAMTLLGNGDRVAVGGDFGIMVARTDTGELLSLAGGFGRVLAIDSDASGERLLAGVEDGTLRVFDAGTGRELLARRTNDNKVNAAVFTPDGAAAVGGSTDTTLSVMGSADGTPLARLTGHSGSLLRLTFDGSGGLWSAARDGSVRRWAADSLTGDGSVRPVPGGSPYLLAAASDGWMVLSRRGEVVWTDWTGRAPDTRAALVIGPALGLVWDARSGRTVVAGPGGVAGLDRIGSVLWRRDEAGTAVAIDGSMVVTGGEGGGVGGVGGVGEGAMLRWIDPATGAVVRELQVPYGPLRSVATHAGRLAAGTRSGEVVLVDTDGSVRSVMVHGGVDSWHVSFSPDGRRLVSAGEDGAVVVLDVATLREIGRGLGHSGAVLAAAFSPDGMRLATGGFDNTVRMWDVESMEEVMRLPGHIGAVTGLAFSTDGRRLATVASDGTMRVHTSSPDAAVNTDGW